MVFTINSDLLQAWAATPDLDRGCPHFGIMVLEALGFISAAEVDESIATGILKGSLLKQAETSETVWGQFNSRILWKGLIGMFRFDFLLKH